MSRGGGEIDKQTNYMIHLYYVSGKDKCHRLPIIPLLCVLVFILWHI